MLAQSLFGDEGTIFFPYTIFPYRVYSLTRSHVYVTFMYSNWGKMKEMDPASKELRRFKLELREIHRVALNFAIARDILESAKSGESVELKLAVLAGKKERYLEALSMYDSLGLTSVELFKKRDAWLSHPRESEVSRAKTVSIFLQRLKRAGLVRRVREGHSWRYFISKDGVKRLKYYEDKRQALKNKARQLGFL